MSIFAFLYGLSFADFLPIIGRREVIGVFAVVFFAMEIQTFRKAIKSKGFMFLCVSFAYFMTNLIINLVKQGGMLWNVNCINCIAMIFFIHQCCLRGHIRALKSFLLACNIWVLISFVDVTYNVFISHSVESTWHWYLLCGYDNGLGAYLLAIMILNLIFYIRRLHRPFVLLFATLAALQLFFVWSVTAMIGVILIAIVYYCVVHNIFMRLTNAITISCLSIIVFIIVVIMQTYRNPLTEWIIAGVFRKSMDLSIRTLIWMNAISNLQVSPLIGNGFAIDKFSEIYYGNAAAHNIILDVLNVSGIVGFILFLAMIVLILRTSIEKNLEKDVRFALSAFSVFLVILQFESYANYYGYPLIFGIAALGVFHCDCLHKCGCHTINHKSIMRGLLQ